MQVIHIISVKAFLQHHHLKIVRHHFGRQVQNRTLNMNSINRHPNKNQNRSPVELVSVGNGNGVNYPNENVAFFNTFGHHHHRNSRHRQPKVST